MDEPNLPQRELADKVELTLGLTNCGLKAVVGYESGIEFDPSKPDGSQRKFMDSQRLNVLGWQPEVSLNEGLTKAYSNFVGRI
mgnify:CR=1 FL=1